MVCNIKLVFIQLSELGCCPGLDLPFLTFSMYSNVIQHNEQNIEKKARLKIRIIFSIVACKVLLSSFGARTKVLFEFSKLDYTKCQEMEARKILSLLSVIPHLHVDRKILSLVDDVTQAGKELNGCSSSSQIAAGWFFRTISVSVLHPFTSVAFAWTMMQDLKDISNTADGNECLKKIKFFLFILSLGQVGGYVVPFLEGCCKTCKWLLIIPASQVSLICYLVNKVDYVPYESLTHISKAFPSFTHVNNTANSRVKSKENTLTWKHLLHW